MGIDISKVRKKGDSVTMHTKININKVSIDAKLKIESKRGKTQFMMGFNQKGGLKKLSRKNPISYEKLE